MEAVGSGEIGNLLAFQAAWGLAATACRLAIRRDITREHHLAAGRAWPKIGW